MVDMNATASASGLKHPIGNNIEVLPEIENEDCEIVTIITDHEEGQIIEDVEFEDISSDEDPIVFTEADEASMRKRIEELELRNAELEKIANISVINNYDLGTNKTVPKAENKIVDIIELSDYEYPPNEVISSAFVPYDANYNALNYYSEFTKINSCFPPNSIKTYHKSRKHRKRAHSSENKNYDESRSGKICRYKKRRRRSRSSSLGVSNTTKQKSSNAKHHHSRSKRSKRKRRVKNQYDSFSNNSDSEKSEGFELDREELRKAVKRNSETIRKGNLQNIVTNKNNKIMNENKDNNDDDVIEIENNKEVEQITSKLTNEDKDNNVLVSDDSESLEEQTLRLIALKSAIVKKHLDRQKRKELEEKKPYSPSDFDYWCTGINTQNSPKDFDDLECTDSNNISPSESPINISEEEANTKPIDIEIDNSDSDSDIPQFIDTPTPWQSTLPSLDILKKLAPPPPQITLFSPTELRVDNKYIKDCIEDDSKLIISQKNSSPEDLSDEEELALRALLLSKMNSPKVNNNNIVTKKTILTENSQNTVINKIIDTHTKNIKLDILEIAKSPNLIEAKDSNDNDSNTDFFQNILEKAKNTESLLKEAVKRLKTTTLNDSENDDISDGNNYHNQNKADKCTQLISNIKNNFKEIQFSVDRELSESILETNIVSPNSSDGHELLIKSRKKLNNFMQNFNKEKLSNCELDEIQNSTETSDEDQEPLIDNNSCDIEKPEEENRSQTCIEALQKIIEMNYQKLVNVRHETNIVEFSAEHEKEIITDVKIPLGEESSLQEHIETYERLKSKKSCLSEQTEILKPPKRELSCSSETKEMFKQHEKEVSCSFKNKETLKQYEKEGSYSLDNVQISKPVQKEKNCLLNIVEIGEENFGNDQANKEHFENIETETANKNCTSVVKLMQNKIDTSLEITKKIESLQKLSDSIEQAAKITAKAKASLDVNNSQSITSKSLITNHIVQNRKIVKINKIINQTTSSTLNRNHVLNQNIPSNKLSSSSSVPINSRLSPKTINETSSNSLRISKINRTNGKIIICIGVTSSEEEDDFLENLDEKNKHEEVPYDDNASPMSFQMDSPYNSPLVNSFNEDEHQEEECQQNLTTAEENKFKNVAKIEKNLSLSKNVVNDVFQAKLDKFLKNARTQVELEKQGEKTSENSNLELKTPVLKTVQSVNSSVATPVAVRHLPESSQLEYRMLINRMKILERQKFLKNQQEIENVSEVNLVPLQLSNANEDSTSKPDNSINSSSQNEYSIALHDDNRCNSHSTDEPIKENNSHNVEENSKKLNLVVEENDQIEVSVNDIKKDKKFKQNLELLNKYETAYEKNSNSIIENLNRSLKFVAMGKEAKTKKVILESKLAKLKIELKICETDIKLQNQKIAKIYPAISKSYNTIVNLKGRRLKLNKISKHLGKVFNGASYRLKETHSTEIEHKFKHLSNEINNLKNLKICDIEKTKTDLEIKNTVITNVNSKIILPKNTVLTSGEIEQNKQKIIRIESENVGLSTKSNNSENCKVSISTRPPQLEELKKINVENNIEATILQNNSPDLDQNETEIDGTSGKISIGKSQKDDETKYEYISPLDFLNERQNTCSDSTINPNEVICPFQLMGQCDDKDCKYNHLNLDYFSHSEQ